MKRFDIEFTKGQSILLEYPQCSESIVSMEAQAKKRKIDDDFYDLTNFYSISGDLDNTLILNILDSAFMDDWEQWWYDIRIIDTDGKISYPFYGLIYKNGGHPPRRDADLP